MAKAYGSAIRGKVASGAGALAQGSFFNRVFSAVLDFISGFASRSAIGGFLSSYRYPSELYGKSLLHGVFIKKPSGAIRRARGFVADKYESSAFCCALEALISALLRLSLQSYGLMFAVMGAGLVSTSFFRYFVRDALRLVDDAFIAGIVCAAGGFVLLFSRKSLARGIAGSRMLRFLFIELIGVRRDALPQDEPPVRRFVLPAVLGAAVSLGALALPAGTLFMLIGAAAAVLAVLKSCEFGTLVTIVALPFLPTMTLVALCVLTLFSFLWKWLRGKRIIRFDGLDFCVLLFVVMLLYGAFDSLIPSSSVPRVMVYLAFMSSYFVIVNTMRTVRWSRKMAGGLIVAGVLSALLGVYQNYVGMDASLVWVDREMFGDIASRVIGPFDNPNAFGEYLVMLMPLCAAVFFVRRGRGRIAPLIAFALMGAALIFTNSRGAWLGFIASFIIFLMMYSRFFVKLMVVGIAGIPMLPSLLPDSVVNRFMSIGNLADSSTAYRVSIWQGSLRIIKNYWASGVGVGSDVFLQVYQPYSLSGAAYALHSHNLYMQIMIELGIGGFIVFAAMIIVLIKLVLSFYTKVKDGSLRVMALGLMCGVIAFLIQGLTDNVWYNLRIFLMFWICMAVASGLRRSHYTEVGQEGFSQ